MGLQKFSIEEVHHEHPRTADTQHDAQWQRTEGSIRGNGGCNRLFVEGLPWIARMGKPKRANYFKARDHDSLNAFARRRADCALYARRHRSPRPARSNSTSLIQSLRRSSAVCG